MLAEGVTLCCCCCCGEIGSACRRLLGVRRVTKINYLVMVLLFVLPVMGATYLLDLLSNWLHLAPGQVIARCSFVLLLLFLCMLAVSLCRNRVSMVVNEGLFTVKFIILVVLFIAALLVSSSFFEGYSQVARILSLAYILIQSVILIDIFYIMGRSLVRRYEEGEEECGGILVGLSVLLFAGAIAINVVGYVRFGVDGCGSMLWLNIAVSVGFVVMIGVQMIQLNPQNNLLTTSLVSLLASYLAYAAQLSLPGCNARLTPVTYLFDVGVNLFLFILATYGTIAGGLGEEVEIERKGTQTEAEQAGLREYSEGNTWIQWHSYMCLASVYLCMVFSNWLAVEVGQELRGSQFACWVRVAACLATILLFLWTMVAPALVPNRNFEIQ